MLTTTTTMMMIMMMNSYPTQYYGMGDYSRVGVAFAPSWYLINHPGQLSLAIPSWVGAMSTIDGHGLC